MVKNECDAAKISEQRTKSYADILQKTIMDQKAELGRLRISLAAAEAPTSITFFSAPQVFTELVVPKNCITPSDSRLPLCRHQLTEGSASTHLLAMILLTAPLQQEAGLMSSIGRKPGHSSGTSHLASLS